MGSIRNGALGEFFYALSRYEDEKGEGHIAGSLSALSLNIEIEHREADLTSEEIDTIAKKVSGYYHGEE